MSHLALPSSTQRSLSIYPSSPVDESYDVTIRFSTSLPDLPLSIPASANPTTATLKQQIRSSLPAELRNKRIRLIHAGKALDDGTPLSATLKRVVSKPPSRVATPGPYDSGTDTDRESAKSKAKGKLAVRDPPAARVYIHCSIGDVTLSDADLEAEARLASPAETGQQSPSKSLATTGQDATTTTTTTTTTPAPRGFDRLLASGFSASEVQSLRLQFIAIQSHTHTPDTMPSPSTLRALEDQWLDNSNSSASPLTNLDDATGAAGPGVVSEDDRLLAQDDIIWGTTLGFFWPVACLVWGLREDGIFSPRRKIAVVIGLVLNLGLGFARWGG